MTLGYACKKEDLAKGDERHGCLATGDIAKRDRDGFYYITGRKKRFLKILGNRVNLDETEQILKAHFPGNGIACTGKDDCMDIFAAGCPAEMKETISSFLSQKTSLNPSVFRVHLIEEIPKNNAGKILYSELNIPE